MVETSPGDPYQRGSPAWDIGRAQPAFVELANAGIVRGRVLDVGCGTGELALELADRGHEVLGIDTSATAIGQARSKAVDRGLGELARFEVRDALCVARLRQRFDTVVDCGLFHGLGDAERRTYEQQVGKVLAPGGRLLLMVMSDWEDPQWGGPRRVSQSEILDAFGDGWVVDDIQPARFLTTPSVQVRGHAWLATIERKADETPVHVPAKAAKAARRPKDAAPKRKAAKAKPKRSAAKRAKPRQHENHLG